MQEIIIKTSKGKEIKKYIFDATKENCPLCDKPLIDSVIQWKIFHGEVNRSCCNSAWQIKDFCPPEGEEENYKEFFNELNKPENAQLKIDEKFWLPLREAFETLGFKNCASEKVFEYIKIKYPELFD